MRGEEERPHNICMKGEKSTAGRKLLQVDKNLDKLICQCGALWRENAIVTGSSGMVYCNNVVMGYCIHIIGN